MKSLKKVTSYEIIDIEKNEDGFKIIVNTEQLYTSLCLINSKDSRVIDLETNINIHFLLADGSNIDDLNIHDYVVHQVSEPNLEMLNDVRQQIIKDNYRKQLVLSYLPKAFKN